MDIGKDPQSQWQLVTRQAMDITQEDVIQIIRFLNECQFFEELHLEVGDLKLILSKKRAKGATSESIVALAADSEMVAEQKLPSQRKEASHSTVPFSEKTAKMDGESCRPENFRNGMIPIYSPMLGIFYSAPKPDALPFVELGKLVTEEDTLCLIEVMKLFSAIKAGIGGRIVKICAENGQMVEYNQLLFLIEVETMNRGTTEGSQAFSQATAERSESAS